VGFAVLAFLHWWFGVGASCQRMLARCCGRDADALRPRGPALQRRAGKGSARRGLELGQPSGQPGRYLRSSAGSVGSLGSRGSGRGEDRRGGRGRRERELRDAGGRDGGWDGGGSGSGSGSGRRAAPWSEGEASREADYFGGDRARRPAMGRHLEWHDDDVLASV